MNFLLSNTYVLQNQFSSGFFLDSNSSSYISFDLRINAFLRIFVSVSTFFSNLFTYVDQGSLGGYLLSKIDLVSDILFAFSYFFSNLGGMIVEGRVIFYVIGAYLRLFLVYLDRKLAELLLDWFIQLYLIKSLLPKSGTALLTFIQSKNPLISLLLVYFTFLSMRTIFQYKIYAFRVFVTYLTAFNIQKVVLFKCFETKKISFCLKVFVLMAYSKIPSNPLDFNI